MTTPAATKIAVVQMTSGIDPAANAAILTDAIHQSAAAGAAMLFAPEMSGLIDRDRPRARPHVVSEDANVFVSAARAAARQAGIWVHIGSVPLAGTDADPRFRNHSIVIDDQGEVRARYDKIHLFDVDLPTGESWRESSAYAPGDAPVVVDTPLGGLGMTICYDMRFAGLFDTLGAAGARVIAVPSAFTVPTGQAHWHLLLRTRAIDQGCFIIAAAQVGTHEDGRETYGHSLVVDPWGRVLLDMGDAPGLGFAELDWAIQADTRARLPVLAHRRPLPPVTHG
ncbi:MAG: carbon-nitrogen hydrolase family protein [Sphingopyxis sp.]